ncbi:hypothetical protein [Amycolatopsis sp. cmx-11-32]|uniref:hypothetical protein n=1 Tax=Amycolatopsis sp. cmx-11-32 TaxID=2785796 RepID=UPI0039E3BCEC
MTLDEVTITGGHTRDGAGTNADGERNWGPLGIIDSVIVGNTTGSTAPVVAPRPPPPVPVAAVAEVSAVVSPPPVPGGWG